MRGRRRFVAVVSAAVTVVCMAGFWATSALSEESDRFERGVLWPADWEFRLYERLTHRFEQGLPVTDAEKEECLALESRYSDLRGGDVLDNQGGPDAFRYVFADNVSPDNIPYEWIELRGDPAATWLRGLTHFTSVDDGYSRRKVPIGFAFPFYGAVYDCVRVATNGFLQFTTTSTSGSNACLPSTAVGGPMIAMFWDDLHLLYGGRADTMVVGYRNFGDYFVIEYDEIGFYTSSCRNVPLKFEAILYLNGDIKLQYATVTSPASCRNSQSIGIQRAGVAGSAALNYVCNSTGVQPADGRAILFSHGIPNPPANLTATYSGATGNVVLTWQDPTRDTAGDSITIDNVQVWAGAVGSGQLLATVARGVQTYTEIGPPVGFRNYAVRAYRNPFYGAAVSRTVMVGNPSYFSDFEADNGGWVADPATGGWEWGTPTFPATLVPHSGTKLWGTVLNGNYPASACFKLTLAPNMTVASPGATVEFWSWRDTEQASDGVNFKVSTDQGATWTLAQPSGGYPYTSATSTACIPSEPYWSGQTGGAWTQVIIPLGQFLGQMPMFRFTFGADASLQRPGFFLDDLIIAGMGPASAVPRPPTGLVGSYAGGNVTLTWTDPNQDINGQPIAVDSIQIWLGTIAAGQRIGAVGAGVQTFTQLNAPSGRRTYTVRAFAGGFASAPASVQIAVGVPEYNNNFEVNNGGWVADPPIGGWEWGIPTDGAGPTAHSGSRLWGTVLAGNYADSACYKLELAPGLVVRNADASVEFWAWYRIEGDMTAWDGCNFKVSSNDGATWQHVQPVPAYDDASTSTGNVCIPSEPSWNGTTAGNFWHQVTVPLGAYVGQIVRFRFSFGSGPSVTYPGFFFDDMQIWGLRPRSGITGVVRAFQTNMPIPDARVWADGVPDAVTTDSTGSYTLLLDPGTYTLGFRHIHFCDTTCSNVVVELGSQTARDMVMRAPRARVSRTSLTLLTTMGVDVIDTFGISNPGGQCPLSFTVSDTSAWLSVEPAGGSVAPNQNTVITVRAAVAGLAVGDYGSAVVVSCNAVGSPSTIRVDLYVGPSEVDAGLSLPTEFACYPNYPNPFNAQTSLRFDVPQQSRVQIVVYNVMGQEVARPVDGVYAPGRHQVLFDAGDLPSGMYLARMSAAGYTQIGKMMLLK